MREETSIHFNDELRVTVRIEIPRNGKDYRFDHVFDAHGMKEEFAPLPDIYNPWDMVKRKELLEKRERTVDMVAKTIARSILVALEKNPK